MTHPDEAEVAVSAAEGVSGQAVALTTVGVAGVRLAECPEQQKGHNESSEELVHAAVLFVI